MDNRKKKICVIGPLPPPVTGLSKALDTILTSEECRKCFDFTVVDLGVDVGPEQYVDAIKNQGVQIVAMSALLTTTMLSMKEIIDAITAAGLRDQVKVMIGGAPVTKEFADEIGADGYSPDAASAVDLAKRLVAQMK